MDNQKKLEEAFLKLKQDISSYDRVLIAGGDGTVNLAVNLMIKYDIDLPLGIYPAGTCNDFAMFLGASRSVSEQTETLLGDHFELCDVGRINDRYFVNVASFGAFVASGQRTDEVAKNLLGPLDYYLKAVEELISLEAIKVTIEADSLRYEGYVYLVIIMNGRSAGGFHKLGRLASINDGLLDVLIFKKCSVLELPTVLLEVMAGNHLQNKNVISFKTSSMKIFCDETDKTDIDGEKGPSFPLDIQVVPRKLKVICKKEMNTDETSAKRRKNG